MSLNPIKNSTLSENDEICSELEKCLSNCKQQKQLLLFKLTSKLKYGMNQQTWEFSKRKTDIILGKEGILYNDHIYILGD